MAPRILIVAGEASGDIHAARLVQDVLKINPKINFFGMGGINMRQAGVNIILDIKDLAIIGVLDVLLNLGKILKAKRILKKSIKNNPPDMLILVDYPGFNLRLAKIAHKAGIKVFYYIAPKLWASRPWRIKTIKKYVDKMAVIFPFEVTYFKKLNYPVTFVGNPLTNAVRPTMSRAEAIIKFDLNPSAKTVGLFPGSRQGEIKRMLPIILQAAAKLQAQFKNIQFIMPLASTITKKDLAPYLEQYDLDIKIISDKIYDIMQVCNAAIAVSGTVTLEAALMSLPIVIIYKVFPPYFPIHWVTIIPYIGLCNIVAGKKIVQELLQQHANAKNISTEITKILTNTKYRNNMVMQMQRVQDKLIAKKSELGAFVQSAILSPTG